MKSVMKHKFSEVPQANIPRSSFDRSHGVKTTFDAGYIVPMFADEAVPGDTFNLKTSGLVRMSTPIFPVMDNIFFDTFYFSVPFRLIWDNFQKAMGEQNNPGDSVDFVTPKTTAPVTGYAAESLQDYLGIPTIVNGLEHSALWTRAYNLIYNEWFRDQNLQDSVVVDTDDGPDTNTDYVLLRRGKRHDYFTSCLPWPQKGTAVDLPIGQSAPIVTDGTVGQFPSVEMTTDSNNPHRIGTPTTNWATLDASTAIGSPLYADLSNATASTINQLRQAYQVQAMYEKDARAGTRYTEIIQSHFGVTSPDARLQRPEFLGGGSSYLNVTPVANTANTGVGDAPGDLGAFATSEFTGHGFHKSFTEHCIVLGFVNVRADLTYQQGLNRMWSRDDRLEYYWPSLSVIGEQAVLNKEIYATSNATTNDEVFGYQERYAEYRYKPSQITGKFRSNTISGGLDAWHLSQDFASQPALNASFIEDNPPIDRVVRVTSEPDFWADFHHNFICARPMPLYGIPATMGRF